MGKRLKADEYRSRRFGKPGCCNPWPLGRQHTTLLPLPQAASPPSHTQYNRSEAPGCSKASCYRYRNSSISLKSVCQQRRRCKNTVWELTKPALSYRNADSHNHPHTGSSTIFSTRREAAISEGPVPFDPVDLSTVSVPEILCYQNHKPGKEL